MPAWAAMVWQSHLTPAVAGHGSLAGENDALYAAAVSGVSLQLFGRTGALLDGQQSADHRADKAHKNEPGSDYAAGTIPALTPPLKKKK
jgi:hypothetical protein